MLSLQQIESDLTAAIKAKNQIAVDTLRGLKTRIQNAAIEKKSSASGELLETDLVVLVKSEVKRRKESAAAFTQGGREEMSRKELQEASILEKYLPAQMPEGELVGIIDKAIAEGGFTSKEFGKAMGVLKAKLGNLADGALLAKILKEKLK